LKKHWPDVPKWRDVKDVTAEEIKFQTGCNNITLMSGGFPCQDTSYAGLQAGLSGKRSGLVYEQLRLLANLQPDYAVFENVSGLRTNGLRELLTEIAKIGYDAEWYSLRASGFGAPHKRERIFIVAHSKRYKQQSQESWERVPGRMGGIIKSVPWDTTCKRALCKFRGVDDGSTYRVDRTDTIRNAVVPQQVYPILKTIADIENGVVK
jgi:DNA (cytosine-5)-methyltransferase 1